MEKMVPSRTADEAKRLEAVREIRDCNDTEDASLGTIFDVVREVLSVESANFTLMGEGCVNIKQTNSSIIVEGTDIDTKSHPLCYWTLVPEDPQVMIVDDMTKDARTEANVLTTNTPFLRFYAAVPLVTCNKQRIGNLCLVDTKPQQFGSIRAAVLSNFAEILMWILEGNVMQQRPLSPILIGHTIRTSQVYQQACALVDLSTEGWRIMYANKPFEAITGQCTGMDLWQFMLRPEGMEEAQRGPQPHQFDSLQGFNLRKLRLKADAQGSSLMYDIELRPAHTSQLHRDAHTMGTPARPDEAADDLAAVLDNYFFVLLTPSKIMSSISIQTPIDELRVGTALGAGDFAKVFRGTYCGERVAVKVIKDPGEALSEGDVPLEVLLLDGLSHPNLVGLKFWKMAVTAAGQQRLWLILDFCNRGTLADAVDKGWFRAAPSQSASISSATILAAVKDIATGLAYLHLNKILHCDLSGGNVLLDSHGLGTEAFTAKIADFGFARRMGRDYSDSSPSGNYAYLAPEVMEGEAHTPASDIWSLGVLLQEMLTGQKAWGGLSHSQIAYAVLWEKRSLEVKGKGLLQSLALRCMHFKATARPTANQVLQMLEGETSASVPTVSMK